MNQEDFIREMAEILEVAPSSLTPDTELRSHPLWDSVAIIGFMALCDEQYGRLILFEDLKKCETIYELFEMARKSEPIPADG